MFVKFRSVGVNRTKSASPRVSSVLSMPDLQNCALLGEEDEGGFYCSPTRKAESDDRMDVTHAVMVEAEFTPKESFPLNFCDIPSPDSIAIPGHFHSPRLRPSSPVDAGASAPNFQPSLEAPARLQAPLSLSPSTFTRRPKQRANSIACDEQVIIFYSYTFCHHSMQQTFYSLI